MPRNFVRHLLLVSVAALLAGGAWAADYTRLPGNGAWQDSTLWSPTGFPGASDTARFESTSGSVTLTAATSVGLLDLAGTYTGMLDLNGQTLTAGQVSMAGGTLVGGSGSLTVTGSMALAGGTLNAPSTLTLRGNVDFSGGTFAHNDGTTYFSVNYNTTQSISTGTTVFNQVIIKGYAASTTTINGDLSVAGDLSFGMSGYSGCLLNGGRILAQKNVRMDSPSFGTGGAGPGSATIVFCGAGDQTLDGAQAGRFPNVKIEKPSGIFRLAGAPQVFGSWTWAGADSLDAGAALLTIATPYNATVTVNGGPYSYGGTVTFKGWGQFSKHDLSGDFLVRNLDLSMVAYSGNQITGASFVVSGDVKILDAGFGSASWGPGNSTIKLVGGDNHLIASYAAGHFPNMVIDTAGSVATEGDVIVSGNWTLVNGTLTQGAGTTLEFQAPYGGTQTITPGAVAYGNVKISGDGLSIQNVAGTLNCQNFTLTTRAYTGAKLNGEVVAVHGDFTLPGDGFGATDGGPGSATVRLAGNGTVTAGGLARCPSLVVDTSGTITFVGSLRLGSHYAHASGTVVAAGSTQTFVGRQDSLIMGAAQFGTLVVQKGPYGAPYKVTIDGNATASGGFTLTEGTFVFAENASLAVAGDVSVAAANVSVTAGNDSTLGLSGAAAQSVNLANHAVFNMSVTNASAPVTFTGAYTALGTTSAAPGSALVFASGVTFNTGKLTMNGTQAQGIVLRASTEGSAANVVVAPYQFVRYADIKDINASGGPKIVALHSMDIGNNQNVVFQNAALLAISTQATSKTSPAWVEGVSGPDATSINVTVDGVSFAAARLNPTQWYAQNAPAASSLGVVLNPDAASSLDVTAANAFGESHTAHQDLGWASTDFAGKSYSTDLVKIRKGDSLLLTATGAGTTLEIDGDGDGVYEHAGAPGQKFPHLYSAPGSFVARAKIDGVEVGSITVVVVSTDLHGPIACQKDFERDLQVFAYPTVEAPNISYVAEDPYRLKVTTTQVTSTGANLKLKPSSMENPPLISRLGSGGPILAIQPTTVFNLELITTGLLAFQTAENGFYEGAIVVKITPRTVIDNDNPNTQEEEGLFFKLQSSGPSLIFLENGLSSIRVHSRLQDEDGIIEVPVRLDPSGTACCHSVYAEQVNSQPVIVSPSRTANPCILRLGGGTFVIQECNDEREPDVRIESGKQKQYKQKWIPKLRYFAFKTSLHYDDGWYISLKDRLCPKDPGDDRCTLSTEEISQMLAARPGPCQTRQDFVAPCNRPGDPEELRFDDPADRCDNRWPQSRCFPCDGQCYDELHQSSPPNSVSTGFKFGYYDLDVFRCGDQKKLSTLKNFFQVFRVEADGYTGTFSNAAPNQSSGDYSTRDPFPDACVGVQVFSNGSGVSVGKPIQITARGPDGKTIRVRVLSKTPNRVRMSNSVLVSKSSTETWADKFEDCIEFNLTPQTTSDADCFDARVVYMHGLAPSDQPLDAEIEVQAQETHTVCENEQLVSKTDSDTWVVSDTEHLTVCKIERIDSMISATPCKTMRPPQGADPDPRAFSSTEMFPTWEPGASIVLIENSMDQVPLTTTVIPSSCEPRWTVIRNPDDNPQLKTLNHENLTLSSETGSTNSVTLDAIGSFSVIAYIDLNRNGVFDLLADCPIYYNMVVSRVSLNSDDSKGFPEKLKHNIIVSAVRIDGEDPTPGAPLLISGFSANDSALDLSAKIDIICGGSDGRLGVERVRSCWINNIEKNELSGEYEGDHKIKSITPNADLPAPIGGLRYRTQTLPELLSPPLSSNQPMLDASPLKSPGTGGDSSCLTSNLEQDLEEPLPLGVRRSSLAKDAPQFGFILVHPKFLENPKRLTRAKVDVDFRAYLAVWTGTVSAANSEPGANLYSCIEEVPWGINSNFSLVYDPNNFNSPPTVTNEEPSDSRIPVGPGVPHAPTTRLSSTKAEICPPIFLPRSGLFDATE